ncbi:Hypothetical protein D9617_20g026700 [Elsinoe fawcettii]|nr:Hypothetical protein D9617_20g026700 [Elsinoe fawcettii]
MRALLEKSQRGAVDASSKGSPSNSSNSDTHPRSNAGFMDQRSTLTPASLPDNGPTALDVVDRGLISAKEAQSLLELYIKDFVPHFPLVLIPKDQTAERLRREQPLLFSAVMATASSKGRPQLYSVLSTEVIQDYISRVMIKGQKSLEIVKAILITCAWYFPTDRWSTLKFYEYTHLASTIAVDIGLGERDTALQPRDEADTKLSATALMLEKKRSLLACYAQCASISLSMRRPNMFHFTSYMADIGREFETSSAVAASDQSLSAFIRIVNIGEEINVAFSLSDGGREALVSDVQLHQALITYQRKLMMWKDVYRQHATSIDLQVMYHYVRVVLHEVPLHTYYPPSLFRPPFFLQAPINVDIPVSDTSCHCYSQCVAAAHAMLDAFVAQPLDQIRALPCHIFPRIVFALVMLISIKLLPLPSEEEDPLAASGIYHNSTQVDLYLNAVVDRMVEAAGMMEYRIPAVFAGPLVNARKWYNWAMDRCSKGLSADGGLTFGLFTGPDDHPALTSDHSSDTSSNFTGSPANDNALPGSRTHSLANESPFVKPVEATIAVPSATGTGSTQQPGTRDATSVPSTAISPDLIYGKIEGAESQWMDDLQQDYTTMLDPTLFESGVAFGDLSNAFQDFSAMDYSGGVNSIDSIQAFAQADFGSDMGMYTNLPGPMVRPAGPSGQGHGV